MLARRCEHPRGTPRMPQGGAPIVLATAALRSAGAASASQTLILHAFVSRTIGRATLHAVSLGSSMALRITSEMGRSDERRLAGMPPSRGVRWQGRFVPHRKHPWTTKEASISHSRVRAARGHGSPARALRSALLGYPPPIGTPHPSRRRLPPGLNEPDGSLPPPHRLSGATFRRRACYQFPDAVSAGWMATGATALRGLESSTDQGRQGRGLDLG